MLKSTTDEDASMHHIRRARVPALLLTLMTASFAAAQTPRQATPPVAPPPVRSAAAAAEGARAVAAAAASPGGGIRLDEIYALARQRNPGIGAAEALARAVAAREPSASLPPDPTLQLGVMNFTLPGFSTNMPTSMAPSVQAMEVLPFPGKLGLRGRVAEASTGIAEAKASETWWQVRATAATGFYDLYRADRQLEVMRRTLRLLQDFQKVAQAMYAAGEGHQADVLRAGVEVARMQADIAQMEAMGRVSAAKLNAVLDRPAETPIPTPVLEPLPEMVPAGDTLLAWAEATRPLLEAGRGGVQRADAALALARRQIWPDLSIGVQYGQRASDMGTQRMGSAMIGFSLPVFAGKRQLQERDEAAAEREAATADLAEMRAEVRARIGTLLAQLDRARTLVGLYRTDVLPQASATVESSLSAYRVGHVDFMTLVDAQMTENRYEQDYYGLLADYGTAVAELETTLGRALPAAGNLVAEVR